MINTAENLVDTKWNCYVLDSTTIKNAKKTFCELKLNGVIKSKTNYEDDVWYTTDEYKNVGFHFAFDEVSYKRYEGILKMPLEKFILYVKAYIISLFGKNALTTMNEFLLDIRKIIKTTPEEVLYGYNTISIFSPHHCSDFFSMLPNADTSEEIDELIDSMELYADANLSKQQKKQRVLASIDTYLIFDEIIKDYWNSNITEGERLFYYPLYLWWNITGPITLRPREFLLTKRDCLEYRDGNYYMTLRRNWIKGSGRSVSYKIENDYIEDTIKIPMKLGREIEQYLQLTAKYAETDIKTLFVTDPHYNKWFRKTGKKNRYLTYTNMNTILKVFYDEVICGKYGYTVVQKKIDSPLNDKEICNIHLGDTRHIAFINSVMEGLPLSTVMVLAGHTNIDTSSHYFSNMKTFIECKVFQQHRKMMAGKEGYKISKTAFFPSHSKSVNLSAGKCYSNSFLNGSIDDCLKAKGDNGEIGYCPNCIYYRKDGCSYYSNDDIYKKQINNDCVALRKAINAARHQKGDVEDLGEVFLRLNASSVSYEKFLTEKINNKGEKNYAKKEND